MGEEDPVVDLSSCCASCGIAEVDGIKLKNCTACYLVKYCSIKCQREHRPKHKRACKKGAAELHTKKCKIRAAALLRGELLFKQPESTHLGDCPICCLPLPIDQDKSTMMGCCSKMICDGCAVANDKREEEASLKPSCPFCREAVPETNEEVVKRRMKRVEANDPVALDYHGLALYEKGDHGRAFEYFTKAAELGNADAHYRLALFFMALRRTA